MLILQENTVSNTQLNRKIQKKVSQHSNINCYFSMFYAYYLDLKLDFTDQEFQISKHLLLADKLDTTNHNTKYFIVTPRLGVESAWGSKARDIFYASGLNKLKSIEKVKVFLFSDQIDFKNIKDSVFYS